MGYILALKSSDDNYLPEEYEYSIEEANKLKGENKELTIRKPLWVTFEGDQSDF